MYLSLVILPILSAFIGTQGAIIGVTGVQIITTGSIIISTILAFIGFYEICLSGSPVIINICSWAYSDPLEVSWNLQFDDLTISILLAVLVVSSLVHLYSISYISNDPHVQRFISYLSFFTAAIIILVVADSYLIMFVGWESIGVASYLLISFWFTRSQASKAATQAITVNRVGDAILSVGFIALLWGTGGIDYATTGALASNLSGDLLVPIGLLLFGGAMSKSAQVPLHTWLPSAMEGPTPVSALIHAATLVTAGVYLILRSSPLLEYADSALIVISWVGALTAFFAASTGLLQNDLKRVIAYSTCSQLGYMFIAVGLSQYNAALFHLVGHAFFKALLFLSAGAVIHAISDQQDLRRLGGLVTLIPFTYTAILIGSLSLIALPWLTGFYTKDAILELASGQYTFTGSLCYWIGTISAFLTAFYSFRLTSLAFYSTPSATKTDYENTHEPDILIIIPLFILSILAIVFGYLSRDLFIGPGSDFLSSVLPLSPSHLVIIEAEFGVNQIIKLLPAILSIIGAILSVLLYNLGIGIINTLNETNIGLKLYSFFNNRWNIDGLITHYSIIPSITIGLIISKIIDRGIIEIVGPYGLSVSLSKTANIILNWSLGTISTYAIVIIISVGLSLSITFNGFNNLSEWNILFGINESIGIILLCIITLTILQTIINQKILDLFFIDFYIIN